MESFDVSLTLYWLGLCIPSSKYYLLDTNINVINDIADLMLFLEYLRSTSVQFAYMAPEDLNYYIFINVHKSEPPNHIIISRGYQYLPYLNGT